jgi:hypothetical protein
MKLSSKEHLANDYPIPELFMLEIKIYSICLVFFYLQGSAIYEFISYMKLQKYLLFI